MILRGFFVSYLFGVTLSHLAALFILQAKPKIMRYILLTLCMLTTFITFGNPLKLSQYELLIAIATQNPEYFKTVPIYDEYGEQVGSDTAFIFENVIFENSDFDRQFLSIYDEFGELVQKGNDLSEFLKTNYQNASFENGNVKTNKALIFRNCSFSSGFRILNVSANEILLYDAVLPSSFSVDNCDINSFYLDVDEGATVYIQNSKFVSFKVESESELMVELINSSFEETFEKIKSGVSESVSVKNLNSSFGE